MNKFALDKYKFVEVPAKKDENAPNGYAAGPQVIAISSYAGKPVRGVAKCHPNDIENYSLAEGMELAAARCAAKIAQKRVKRAICKIIEANEILREAQEHYNKMVDYYHNSLDGIAEAFDHLAELEGFGLENEDECDCNCDGTCEECTCACHE